MFLLCTLAVLATSTPSSASAQGVRDSTAPRLFHTPPGRNAVMLRASFPVPYYAVALSYDRALGRRFSLGGEFEYNVPKLAYSHLAGFSETANGRVWMGEPLNGVFVETSLTFAHQVLTQAPQFSRTTLAPGAAFGFRYTLPLGLSAGLSVGLRHAIAIVPQPLLCTYAEHCAATRAGTSVRLALDLGWVF